MKTKILIVAFLCIAASGIMASLTYHFKKPAVKGGGFERSLVKVVVSQVAMIQYEHKLTGIVGMDTNYYYFTGKQKGKLLISDHRLKQVNIQTYSIPKDKNVQSLLIANMEAQKLFFLAGNAKKAFVGHVSKPAVTTYEIPDNYYYLAVPVSDHTIIVKGIDSATKADHVFKKYDLLSSMLKYEKNLSPRMHDGGISDDGILTYDTATHLLVYIRYYSNKITCFDTSLRLIYHSKTIDTFITPNMYGVRTRTISGEPSFSPVGPPDNINFLASVSEGKLYVNSLVKADNEDTKTFRKHSVVDVYNIANGKYTYSFYVPTINGKHMTSFKIFRDRLVAIYGNTVVLYALHLPVSFITQY